MIIRHERVCTYIEAFSHLGANVFQCGAIVKRWIPLVSSAICHKSSPEGVGWVVVCVVPTHHIYPFEWDVTKLGREILLPYRVQHESIDVQLVLILPASKCASC